MYSKQQALADHREGYNLLVKGGLALSTMAQRGVEMIDEGELDRLVHAARVRTANQQLTPAERELMLWILRS